VRRKHVLSKPKDLTHGSGTAAGQSSVPPIGTNIGQLLHSDYILNHSRQ
jgi:hypothetical protein